MILWLGTYCFGLVLGWLSAYLFHHNRAVWREIKAALGVLFGATLQGLFGGIQGMILYGIGVAIGAALYGVTLLVALLRRAHSL
jgi:sugar phosphate permease